MKLKVVHYEVFRLADGYRNGTKRVNSTSKAPALEQDLRLRARLNEMEEKVSKQKSDTFSYKITVSKENI